MKQLDQAKKYWEQLGDIPVNENEELDEDFIVEELGVTFNKGTHPFEVWHWFEETFDVSVAKDLMYTEK